MSTTENTPPISLEQEARWALNDRMRRREMGAVEANLVADIVDDLGRWAKQHDEGEFSDLALGLRMRDLFAKYRKLVPAESEVRAELADAAAKVRQINAGAVRHG